MSLRDFFTRLFCRSCILENLELEETLDNLLDDNLKLSDKIEELEEELEELQKDVIIVDPPKWLDTGKFAYMPKIQYHEGNTLKIVVIDQTDIYNPSNSLSILVENMGWEDMEHDEKLKSIWEFVIKRLKYAYDTVDAWHYPTTTYYRYRGDCEDGTILFVTLAAMSGIPEDSIFNACGWVTSGSNKFGHSYPIAKMEDGKWYIFETTLDDVPSKPKLFKGSNYTADWGVANGVYQGVIDNGLQI